MGKQENDSKTLKLSAEDQGYINQLEAYKNNLRQNVFYSAQRIDLLIISVSGAGLYASFEILKFFGQHKLYSIYIDDISPPVTWAGILFVVAVILNFCSQWSAYNANALQLEAVKLEVKERQDGAEVTPAKVGLFSPHWYNRLTYWLNLASNIIMIFGLILLTCSIPRLV